MKAKYRYKIGQEVQVKRNLSVCCSYFMRSGIKKDMSHASPSYSQVDLAGAIVHISKIENGKYLIAEDSELYYWFDEMFEDLRDEYFFDNLF